MSNSFTRLASATGYDNALRNLTTRYATMSALQENLTSGKKILRSSDDPTGAAQAERANTRIDRIKTEQRALDTQVSAITQAEATLGNANDLLREFRTLVVQAGDGANSPVERETIAKQLVGIRDELITLAQRQVLPQARAYPFNLLDVQLAQQTTGAGTTFLRWRNLDRSAMGVALWESLLDRPATPVSLIDDLYAIELQRIVLNMQISLTHSIARLALECANRMAQAEATYRRRVHGHVTFIPTTPKESP